MSEPLQLPIAIPRDKVAEICDRYQVAELAVFGSILTPDFGPDSDVDFLVTFKPGATIGLEFFDLKAELEDLVGRRVDLVTRLSLRQSVRPRIVATARTLHVA